MNLIKALLVQSALCFKFTDEILLLKCKIPLREDNIEMFTNSMLSSKITIFHIENDCQIIDLKMNAEHEIRYVQETKIFYISLDDKISQKILEAIKYKHKQSYFILEFNFNEKKVNLKLCFKLIKALNQTSMDIIELSSKEDQVKVQNIKDILSNYCLKYLELIDKHKFLDANFFKKHADFKPLYFSTYLECFEALKSFLRPSNFLKIVKNNDSDLDIKGKTVKNFHVIERLYQKFEKDFKNLDNGKNYEKLYSIFKRKVNVFLLDWMNDNLLIPIVSKFDIDRFINNTYSMLHRLFVELQKRPNWFEDRKYDMDLAYEIRDNLRLYAANELFKFIENDSARPRNISKFYSIAYDNKSECNVLDLEKIVCDYNNLMESILNVNIDHDKYHYHNLNYISPLIDCEDERFIKAFTILVDHGIKNIKASNVGGYEVTLTENIDYFIFKHNSRSMYAFPYERIKKQEINKMEVSYKSGEGHLRYSKKILHIDFVMSKVTKIENK